MKVLAVENNAELLKLLSHLLEKEGFETVTATGGKDGLEKFRTHKPDIACLDILLEDISGYDVCREIRAADKAIPILLITSKSRAADVKEGMDAGATEYIIKPFDLIGITTLMYKIARDCLARKNADVTSQHFDVGDLRVFPLRLSGDRAGKSIDLNLREVALLKLLHSRKGQTVTVAELSAHCWSAQDTPAARAVDWQVKQLCRKIEADPANPVLIRPADGGYIHG